MKHILATFSNPVDDDREEEFNDWYTNVHLDDTLKVKGIVSAQLFKLSDIKLMGESKH